MIKSMMENAADSGDVNGVEQYLKNEVEIDSNRNAALLSSNTSTRRTREQQGQ
jgi:hypothetical protein